MRILSLLITLLFAHAAPAAAGDAMWVYKTDAIMADPSACTELFAFCKARHITDLFWGIHYDAKGDTAAIPQPARMRAFLSAANQEGLRIHALSGDPSYALPKNYARAVARVDATVAFNQSVHDGERFAGVHFDIEPHGLPIWKKASQAEKCALLTQLVEVTALSIDRLHATAPGLLFGSDLTFWFDKTNADGTAFYPVTFRGATKDATKHILDMADNIGIMSYRNKAEGKNGIVDLVTKTLAYADTAKGKAYVGVKMANIGPASEGFYGQTEAQMQTALKPVHAAFDERRGYAGIAYFSYAGYLEMSKLAR